MARGISTGFGAILTTIVGADPAANAEMSVTVPAGKIWEVISVSVQLVQAGAGSSQPILTIDDGTNVFWEMFGSSAAQAITTTCRYTWAPDCPLTGQIGATTNVHSVAPLPEGLTIPAGYRIRTNTIGLSGSTDYGPPSLFVVQYTSGTG